LRCSTDLGVLLKLRREIQGVACYGDQSLLVGAY
jgi:hypothetical protein